MFSNNARVILLQPPGLCRQFTRSASIYPPLGLCQLKAVYREASVIDAEGMNWTEEETELFICQARPLIVGMTITSFTIEIIGKWASICKKYGATVLVGGPHATLDPQTIFQRCLDVDIIVRGEGELIFPELMEALLSRQFPALRGVCFRSKESNVMSDEILRVTDFETLPMPDYTGLPVENYWCPDARHKPMLTFMSTRGCPHKCGFCSSPEILGKKVRGWSPEVIVLELERLIMVHNVREISFVDDVFTINKKRLIGLCELLVEKEIKLSWFANARADQIDEEMAEAMAAAGCHQLYLGFESGSQQILNNINKGATVEKLEGGAAILKKHRIDRSIGFVIGLPGESEESVGLSIELAKRIKPERLQFTRFTPLVGSPLEHFYSGRDHFHLQHDDQIGMWIKKAYTACSFKTWGKASI